MSSLSTTEGEEAKLKLAKRKSTTWLFFLSLVQFCVSIVLVAFVIVHLIFISGYYTKKNSSFIIDGPAADFMSCFISCIASIIGFTTWISPFPKKCIVKVHLILLIVSTTVLGIWFCAFTFPALASSEDLSVASKLRETTNGTDDGMFPRKVVAHVTEWLKIITWLILCNYVRQ